MAGLKDVSKCQIKIPEKLKLEIRFRNHRDAKKASYYPGVVQTDPHTVVYEAKDMKDLIVARMFIM